MRNVSKRVSKKRARNCRVIHHSPKYPGESLLDVFRRLTNRGEKRHQYGQPVHTIMGGLDAKSFTETKKAVRRARNLELASREILNPGIVVAAGIPNAKGKLNRHEHINADYTFWTNCRV